MEKSNQSSLTNVIENILCDMPELIDINVLKAVVPVLSKVRV